MHQKLEDITGHMLALGTDNIMSPSSTADDESGQTAQTEEKQNDDGQSSATVEAAAAEKQSSSKPTTIANKKPQQSSKPAKPEKIKVHLVAVGSAPILKKSKFLMNANDQFAVANTFLRKILKLQSSPSKGLSASSLFLYINAAFVPSPDERLGDLYDCFNVRGELVIHYSLQEAWG